MGVIIGQTSTQTLSSKAHYCAQHISQALIVHTGWDADYINMLKEVQANPQISALLHRTKCYSDSSLHRLRSSLTFHLQRSVKQCAPWAGKLCKQPSMRAALRTSFEFISLSPYYAAASRLFSPQGSRTNIVLRLQGNGRSKLTEELNQRLFASDIFFNSAPDKWSKSMQWKCVHI